MVVGSGGLTPDTQSLNCTGFVGVDGCNTTESLKQTPSMTACVHATTMYSLKVSVIREWKKRFEFGCLGAHRRERATRLPRQRQLVDLVLGVMQVQRQLQQVQPGLNLATADQIDVLFAMSTKKAPMLLSKIPSKL